jgi:cobaltochelatase CobN
LLSLEALLDEYVEARQVAAERCDVLEQQIKQLLQRLDWPSFPSSSNDQPSAADQDTDSWSRCLDQVETYLCELKEAQIRTGLHRFGSQPAPSRESSCLRLLDRRPVDAKESPRRWLRRLDWNAIPGRMKTERA